MGENSSQPVLMTGSSSRFLLAYLVAAMAISLYIVCGLWAAPPNPGPSAPPAVNCAPGSTAISGLYPATVGVSTNVASVLIVGCGFTPTAQVRFNGAQHPAIFVDGSHIRAGLSTTDVAQAGSIVVSLSNGEGDYGSAILNVAATSVVWTPLGLGLWTMSQEVQLLIMVLFTGAFGASVYGMKSLANYQGDHKLYQSWFMYYLVRPLEGSGIAFLLYLVIRGGFLSGAAAEKTANQFGICAIAGLAGTFSDIAFLKLREVFMTLFKPQDDRGGKLNLKIATTSLPAGKVGEPYRQALAAGGGAAPHHWTVDPPLPDGLHLDPPSGVISGIPLAASKATYKFTVTDSASPAASAAVPLLLEVTAVQDRPHV